MWTVGMASTSLRLHCNHGIVIKRLGWFRPLSDGPGTQSWNCCRTRSEPQTSPVKWPYWNSYGGIVKRMLLQMPRKYQCTKIMFCSIKWKKAATCKISHNSCYMVYTVLLLLSFLHIPSHYRSWWYETCMTWFLPFLKRHVDRRNRYSSSSNNNINRHCLLGLDCDLRNLINI